MLIQLKGAQAAIYDEWLERERAHNPFGMTTPAGRTEAFFASLENRWPPACECHGLAWDTQSN